MQGDCSSSSIPPINNHCDKFCKLSRLANDPVVAPAPQDPEYDERYLDSGLRVRPSDLLENYDVLTML